eukprot:COSAG02_NODE_3188_length_7205_cov_25.313538_4_plen_129_part_00
MYSGQGHVFDEKDPEKQQVEWGVDMASEHERYLCEVVFKKPVIVYNYPCAIKAFYMRRNDPGTDGAPGPTCAAMDVLVPGVGELIGGSVREERHDVRTWCFLLACFDFNTLNSSSFTAGSSLRYTHFT